MDMGDNDLTCFTDSENAQVKTIQLLNYEHLPCLAHKLNTVLQTFFEHKHTQCPKSILNTIKCCKGIVLHFKQGLHMDLLETNLKQNGKLDGIRILLCLKAWLRTGRAYTNALMQWTTQTKTYVL
jgi:hypothetical protein